MPRFQEQLRLAERHLSADSVLAPVIAQYGPCGLGGKRRDPFQVLCASIVSQQLSSKAADTIHGRVASAFGDRGKVSAQRLAEAEMDALRACGLSGAKAKWLQHLGTEMHSGRLDFKRLRRMSDEEAIVVLDALPGIGRWTAEMFLIFALDRLDLFAMDDVGLRRGVDMLYGKGRKLPDSRVLKITKAWAPYRSVASWYLWRIADGQSETWA